MKRHTLSNPHPDHTPRVGRERRGPGRFGGVLYATTLECSCGWAPGDERTIERRDGSTFTVRDTVVSNEAPSKGGRADANDAYKAHLAEALNPTPTPAPEEAPVDADRQADSILKAMHANPAMTASGWYV